MNLLQKSLRKLILSLLLLVSTSYFLCAQNVKNFTLADGLSGNSILCIFKDSSGLLWIGTETGLCTYDGVNFKTIGEEQGLKYNLVWKIVEDDKKNLWLSVFGYGIAKFDGKKFIYYNNEDGLINNSIRSMYFSKKENCLVLGTEDGLSVFNGKEFKNFKLKPNNLAGNFQVNFITLYKDKLIFGVNHEYLYELKIDKTNFNKSEIRKYYFPDTQNYAGFINGNCFYNRNLNKEFVAHDLKNKSITNFGQCPTIWEIIKTENNEIYAAGWEVNFPKGGLLKIKNGKITDISKDLKLSTSKFWCLYYDLSTKQLWAGSVDQGIFILDLSKKIELETENILNLNFEIRSLFMDSKKNLWLGGNNFIIKKNKTKEIFISKKEIKKKILQSFENKFDKSAITFRNNISVSNDFTCYSIREDKNGLVWVITNFGIICLDQNFNLLQFQFIVETGGILDFADSNNLFVSQNYSLAQIVSKINLSNYNPITYKEKPICLNATKITKNQSDLWIATKSKGLFLYKNSDLISLNDLGFYHEKNLSDVIVDEQGNIISTTQNGKVIFGKWKNNKFSHFKILKPENDIIGNTVFFVRQYKEFYIIGTNKGVNIVKDFKLYKFLSKEEHLLLTEYTDAIVDNISNKLLISTNKGLISVDLEKVLKLEKFNSPIYWNSIKINNNKYPITEKLNLNYDENNIEISFNSNNIVNATKNYYRYKILGISDEWSKYTKESNLKLLSLKSGDYTIILEGKNIGTGEILKPIQLKINISHPFWESWWFIGLIIISLILIIFFVIRRKINNIKEKSEFEKRIAETKLLALQSQMNPHFVFNAMNSIQNFVIDNNVDDALFYIGEFSKLIRQTLDFSGKKYVYLYEEMDYLNRYIELENLRRKTKVVVKIQSDKIISKNEIEIPPMLIQPIIENVFVHAFDSKSQNPKLDISFTMLDNFLVCEISDNGRGIDMNKNSKFSKGIKLLSERISLIQPNKRKNIEFTSFPNKGTIVTIFLEI